MADIFDKMVAGINNGVATVGVRSKAVVEKAKINNNIKNYEEERKQLSALLGMKVYEATINDIEISAVDISNFVAEITKRNQIIAQQQEELRQIDAEISKVTGASKVYDNACTCGNMNVQGAKFCAKCGKGL